jgi:uncharacterized protein (TIGR02996 family)
MTDRELLLRAILEEPADDTLRLVYADFLDEAGGARNQARAELIRVQCEIARTPLRLWERGAAIGLNAAGELVPVKPDGTGLSSSAGLACDPGPPNPALPPLRLHEEAVLKRWAASFLPKCLRPGYPGLRVAGNTVWCDPLGGHVCFERGFAAHAGCELTLSPGKTGPAARRFAQHLAAIFGHNPLSGFSVRFDAPGAPSLHGEIGPREKGLWADALAGTRRVWQINWDFGTRAQFLAALQQPPACCSTRNDLLRAIVLWLTAAIVTPALAVADATTATWADVDAALAEGNEGHVAPPPPGPTDPALDDGDNGYGTAWW